MKVLVSGSTGFIGSELVPTLERAGHEVVRLVRGKGQPGIAWDPTAGTLDRQALEAAGIEGVVHLAGENVAAARWTPEQKRKIRDSRVLGTRLLSEALAGLANPPRVMLSASAVGYYGDRGDEVLTEDSAPGSDFLAEVCVAWEAAAEPARAAGIRVVHPRIGFVLSGAGGPLAKMLTPFRMGAGGPFGSGRQWMPWISIEDVIGAMARALSSEALFGPVNLVSPQPVRNADFARTLGHVLGRPALVPAPAFALKLLLGELSEAVLAGQRVEPARLKAAGFGFRHPELEGALRQLLGK